mgnify:CR=1 FL=1
MSFTDIFRKSFLEGYAATEITILNVIACMLICVVFGTYIFLSYRVVTRKAFFDKNFAISLPITAVITGAIIMTVQSNIVISLGMVGALSIVHFRTAIKDPLDLVFLFWAICIGIICGAGLTVIALVLSIVVTLWLIILDRFSLGKASKLLVINAASLDVEEAIEQTINKYSKYSKVKSRVLSNNELDMVIEVRATKEKELLHDIAIISGVSSVSLLAHDGEVTF